MAANSNIEEIWSRNSAHHANVRESLNDWALIGDVAAQSDLVSIAPHTSAYDAKVRD